MIARGPLDQGLQLGAIPHADAVRLAVPEHLAQVLVIELRERRLVEVAAPETRAQLRRLDHARVGEIGLQRVDVVRLLAHLDELLRDRRALGVHGGTGGRAARRGGPRLCRPAAGREALQKVAPEHPDIRSIGSNNAFQTNRPNTAHAAWLRLRAGSLAQAPRAGGPAGVREVVLRAALEAVIPQRTCAQGLTMNFISDL